MKCRKPHDAIVRQRGGNYTPGRRGDPPVASWEALTEYQIDVTAKALVLILSEYGLTLDNVHVHENVSEKTKGEGQTVLDAILNHLNKINLEVKIPPPIDSSLEGSPIPVFNH